MGCVSNAVSTDPDLDSPGKNLLPAAQMLSARADGIATAENCDPTVTPAKPANFTTLSDTKKPHLSG
ncbi:MAG: hypothetical protein C1943_12195 [Halochromatium sp.]|nr:hypothetical protein [Halochromatium sp.]